MLKKLKKPFTDLEIKEIIALDCKLKGVKTIWFEYGGSGDSGEIYSILGIQEEITLEDFSGYDGKTIDLTDNSELDHYIVDKFLDHIEDWWNNEGGDGKGVINIITGEVFIENNINFLTQETYNHEFDF
jgi:hypothetical protein